MENKLLMWKLQKESYLFVRLLGTNIFKIKMLSLQIAKIISGLKKKKTLILMEKPDGSTQ